MQVFSAQAVQAITSITLIPADQQDIITWQPHTKGICTSKAAYSFLMSQTQVQLPQQGSRSISQQAMSILNRTWKIRSIPPNIKTFAWRLIRRALATGERAARYSDKIDKNCSLCGSLENDSHLFFHCTLPRAVWFSSAQPFCTTALPNELDGIQETLPIIINTNSTDDHILITLTTLWYIWKARNDLRFNQKRWTVFQIHTAVQVDIQTTATALIAQEDLQDPHQQETHAGMTSPYAGPQAEEEQHQQSQTVAALLPAPPFFRLHLQALLEGPRCYSDAAIQPDGHSHAIRPAGLGVFILDTHTNPPQAFFLQVRMDNCASVIMAEAAAMATAAKVSTALHLQAPNYLTDSQQLASYFNSADRSPTPDWRIRHITQNFINLTGNSNCKIFKISREQNVTAHTLARQASRALVPASQDAVFSCFSSHHGTLCPLRMALQSVNWGSCSLITAKCC
jgi:hypothetical protein